MQRRFPSKFVLVCILLGLLALLTPPLVRAQNPSPLPAITVLDIQGGASFQRPGFTAHQPIFAGTILLPGDLLFPQNATLTVLCADGRVQYFYPSQLAPNLPINCPINPASQIIGDSGTKRLTVHRGGRQDPSIPYIIAPRRTVVRTPRVTLRWNPVLDVAYYTLTVRGAGNTWTSAQLDPTNVTQKGVAALQLPFDLTPNSPYTAEICVRYKDTSTHCTTEADWSTGDDVAFYYVPKSPFDTNLTLLGTTLNQDKTELAYAQAVLLSQPFYVPSTTLATATSTATSLASSQSKIGAYSEAISLLEQIRDNSSSSALAKSPELYNLLGELYREINLPLSATQAYSRAAKMATPGTEAEFRALLGSAITTPDSDNAITLYDMLLDEYAKYLDTTTYEARFAALAKLIGDQALDLQHCQTRIKDCTNWYQATPQP